MTMQSHVQITPGGTAFVGPDAVALFRARTIASGLKLYAKTGMTPNRAWTISAMLKAAGKITGQTYKRGTAEQAAADLTIWADAMTAAIPVVS